MFSRPLLVLLTLAAVLGGLGACSRKRPEPEAEPRTERLSAPEPLEAAAPAPPTSFTCSGTPVSFGPNIPPDIAPAVPQQNDFNCFAWAEFISLNWPASASDGGTPAGFGTPGDLSPTQWQTFMSSEQLFPLDGGTPPPWGTQQSLTDDCLAEAGVTAEQARGLLPLMMVSKFSTQFRPSDTKQAFPRNGPSWLGARNGTAVWYEIRVSQPEYEFVVDNGLYTANGQQARVDGGTGAAFVLPMGSLDGGIGSLELKAAWMEVTEPQNAKWNRYKLSPAIVPDPTTQKCRQTQVALVGLHIVHKTSRQPTWVWATFEHVDNAPTTRQDAGTTDWNFYNPSCTAQQLNNLQRQCTPDGGTSVTVQCTPNTPPPYYLGQGCPPPMPIQVTRLIPIAQDSAATNQTAQQAIASAYPNSVWQNYQLINVLWSSSPTSVTAPIPVCSSNKPGCLTFGSPQPSAGTVIANTTMETYIQQHSPGDPYQPSNCVVCHQNAAIAKTAQDPTRIWSSDFSFIFGTAVDVSTGNSQRPPRMGKPDKKAPALEPPQMRRITR